MHLYMNRYISHTYIQGPAPSFDSPEFVEGRIRDLDNATRDWEQYVRLMRPAAQPNNEGAATNERPGMYVHICMHVGTHMIWSNMYA